jgi:beta-galactosidase/beta-glucuronidase
MTTQDQAKRILIKSLSFFLVVVLFHIAAFSKSNAVPNRAVELNHNVKEFSFLASSYKTSIENAKDSIPNNIINYNFNSNWAFYRGDLQNAEKKEFNDKDWFAVTIPHTMRLEKKHNGGGDIYQGIGWYRRYFRISPTYKNKKIEIYFDGVQSNCEVFLNGEKLKSHYGGYIGFVVDLTDKIKFDADNVLAVRVSSLDDPLTPPGKPQTKLDFNYYGGIYRNVKMRITNKLYISDPLEADKIAGGGVFITYSNVSKKSAEVNVKTHVINETATKTDTKLLTLLKDNSGNIVAKAESLSNIESNTDHIFEQSLTIINP